MKTTYKNVQILSWLSVGCLLGAFTQTVSGDQVWLQQYNGFGGDNLPYAMALDSSGNVVVTGASMNQSGNYDYYTAKYAAGTGALLWEARYDGGVGGEDRATSVAVDGLGNVIVIGYSANGNNPTGSTSFNIRTLKYDATGNLLWNHLGPFMTPVIISPGALLMKRVAVDPDGNVIVSGCSDQLAPCCQWNFYTAKYAASDGHPLWEKYYVGPFGEDVPIGLAVDAGGNVIVTGISQNQLDDHSFIETIKYSPAGELVWHQEYDSGPGADNRPIGVALDRDGNVLLNAAIVNFSSVSLSAYYTAKYDVADGHVIWQRLRQTPVDGSVSRDFVVPQSIVVDSVGNAIVNQRTTAGLNNLTKYSSDGSISWEQLFQLGNCIFADPCALALDDADNVIVTGDACLPGGNCGVHRPLTAKYNAADGRLLWQETSPVVASGFSAGPFQDHFRAVAADADGNIVISGESGTSGGNVDYVTIKYTPSGTTLTTIQCPANIIASADPGQCSAVVNFSVTATDQCGSAVPVTCAPPSGSSFPVGTTTVTCTTSDGASCSFTVTINATFSFEGFLSPIDGADATGGSFSSPLRTFKLNSIIPVKFTASSCGSPVLTGVQTLQTIKYSDATTAGTPIDATPSDAATSGNQFRLTDDEWHFNLDTQTSGMSAGTWLLRATLSDGSQHTVWIQIK